MSVANSQTIIKQYLFYLVIGLITLIIDTAVAAIFYDIFDIQAFISSGLGFLAGFIFSFPINRRKVFRHSDKDRFSMRSQLIMYAGLAIFNLIFTSLLVHAAVDWLNFNIVVAKMFTTGAMSIWNFVIFRYLIFSKDKR